MKYTYLGHNNLLFETNDKTIIIDPWFNSPTCTTKIEDIKKVDYILITHGHFDHVGDVVELYNAHPNAIIITNPEITGYLVSQGIPESSTAPQYIGGYVDHKFFSLKAVVAVHGSSLPDKSYGGLAMGFIIKSNDKKVYIAGDTGLTTEMQLLDSENIDLAILPIGGNFTMDIDDAIRATRMIHPKKVIPCHYDTFDVIKQNPNDFTHKVSSQLGIEVEVLDINSSTLV